MALFIIGTSIGTLRVISDNDKLVHYRDLQDNGMCANHSVVAVGRFIRTMHIRIHSDISPVLVYNYECATLIRTFNYIASCCLNNGHVLNTGELDELSQNERALRGLIIFTQAAAVWGIILCTFTTIAGVLSVIIVFINRQPIGKVILGVIVSCFYKVFNSLECSSAPSLTGNRLHRHRDVVIPQSGHRLRRARSLLGRAAGNLHRTPPGPLRHK